METDIYHDLGYRRRNTDKRRKQLPQASKTELPHPDSMSTNADNSPMTTINDNEVARLKEEIEIERKRVTAGWDEIARLRAVCEWAADMMDGISPARGQEIRDASEKPHNQ